MRRMQPHWDRMQPLPRRVMENEYAREKARHPDVWYRTRGSLGGQAVVRNRMRGNIRQLLLDFAQRSYETKKPQQTVGIYRIWKEIA